MGSVVEALAANRASEAKKINMTFWAHKMLPGTEVTFELTDIDVMGAPAIVVESNDPTQVGRVTQLHSRTSFIERMRDPLLLAAYAAASVGTRITVRVERPNTGSHHAFVVARVTKIQNSGD